MEYSCPSEHTSPFPFPLQGPRWADIGCFPSLMIGQGFAAVHLGLGTHRSELVQILVYFL